MSAIAFLYWIAHYERFWDDHLQRLQKHLTKGSEK